MNECNSIEAINRTDLSERTKLRLDEISKVENYFYEEINQRKLCSKKLSKYVADFDYIDKILIVLSDFYFNSNNWRSIYLFVYEHCWSSCRNTKCKFYYNFFSNNRNSQNIIKHNKNQKGKA